MQHTLFYHIILPVSASWAFLGFLTWLVIFHICEKKTDPKKYWLVALLLGPISFITACILKGLGTVLNLGNKVNQEKLNNWLCVDSTGDNKHE